MTMFAIKQTDVRPGMKMRTHAWLNIATGKRRFSIMARDPDLKKWAHVYNPDTNRIRFFFKEERALAEITRLQSANPKGDQQ